MGDKVSAIRLKGSILGGIQHNHFGRAGTDGFESGNPSSVVDTMNVFSGPMNFSDGLTDKVTTNAINQYTSWENGDAVMTESGFTVVNYNVIQNWKKLWLQINWYRHASMGQSKRKRQPCWLPWA
jgi:hypothetical protein